MNSVYINTHASTVLARKQKMKTQKLYQIRAFRNSTEYSIALTQKLRTRTNALRLVKRLKARGIAAFAAPMMVAA